MHERSAIPNPAIDATTDRAADPEAPLAPEDIDARREAMKSFGGSEPVARVPVASALEADRNASDEAAAQAQNATAVADDERTIDED